MTPYLCRPHLTLSRPSVGRGRLRGRWVPWWRNSSAPGADQSCCAARWPGSWLSAYPPSARMSPARRVGRSRALWRSRPGQDLGGRDGLPRMPRAVLGCVEQQPERRARQAGPPDRPQRPAGRRARSHAAGAARDRSRRGCRVLTRPRSAGGIARLTFGARRSLLGVRQHLTPRVGQESIQRPAQVPHMEADRRRLRRDERRAGRSRSRRLPGSWILPGIQSNHNASLITVQSV